MPTLLLIPKLHAKCAGTTKLFRIWLKTLETEKKSKEVVIEILMPRSTKIVSQLNAPLPGWINLNAYSSDLKEMTPISWGLI